MHYKIIHPLLLLLPFIEAFNRDKILWIYYVVILCVLIAEKGVIKRYTSQIGMLLLGPAIWPLLFSQESELVEVLRSVYYLTMPAIFVMLGRQLASTINQTKILKYVIYYGVIQTLLHTIKGFSYTGFSIITNPYLFREIETYSPAGCIIALMTLIFVKIDGKPIVSTKVIRNILIFITTYGIYISASRTYYIACAIFFAAFLYKFNKKILLALAGLALSFLPIVFSVDTDIKLINKFQNFSTELAFGDYTSAEDINTHYRGFETTRAYQTYKSGNILNLIFGHGYGKQVELGSYVKLGESERNYIPVLHNGYLYLLLRAGAVGLIAYLVFFGIALRLKNKLISFSYERAILIGSIGSLLFSNFVISTFYSLEMTLFWVLIGLFGFKSRAAMIRKTFEK